jgi:hypothetical protein
MIKKYTTKPFNIEAIQFFNGDGPNNIFQCVEFIGGSRATTFLDPHDNQLIIKTLEGDMLVSDGDYIIKGMLGEFYPCKPEVFEAKYEEIIEQGSPDLTPEEEQMFQHIIAQEEDNGNS